MPAVDREREDAERLREAAGRLRDEALLVLAVRRDVVLFRVPVLFRAVDLRVEDLRVEDPPVAELALLRTACVRLLRAFLKCVWNSRTALRASPSTFAVAVLILFSIASSDVLSRLSAAFPPVLRDLVVVRRADDERPLALRLVLLRAVVLRAPPVLPAVLRLAVLRAAGDI